MVEAGGRVQSIEKAVRILEILAEAGGPMPLREIARRTALPKSTLHGIISTLRETGLKEGHDHFFAHFISFYPNGWAYHSM